MSIYSTRIDFYSKLEKVLLKHKRNIVKYYEDHNRQEANIELKKDRVLLEAVEILSELSLGPIEIRAREEDIVKYSPFWQILNCDIKPTDSQTYPLKIMIGGKCVAFVSDSTLYLNVSTILSMMRLDKSAEETMKKYYILSTEPGMLLGRFETAIKIRNNGGCAYYDMEEGTLEELELTDKNWVIILLDRYLYTEGRCKVYHYDLPRDQLLGEVYIDNIGKLSYS